MSRSLTRIVSPKTSRNSSKGIFDPINNPFLLSDSFTEVIYYGIKDGNKIILVIKNKIEFKPLLRNII
ncbi:MAG: hypothetical protein BAJALOKI1v1_1740004 [Promethearchaeota archaeon]|nr:MAG: hypothetical protein BAJALOKI1v1_1740004 [Candidatus Lokiarchaeota archaeon]